jgi:hypothetical protein
MTKREWPPRCRYWPALVPKSTADSPEESRWLPMNTVPRRIDRFGPAVEYLSLAEAEHLLAEKDAEIEHWWDSMKFHADNFFRAKAEIARLRDELAEEYAKGKLGFRGVRGDPYDPEWEQLEESFKAGYSAAIEEALRAMQKLKGET